MKSAALTVAALAVLLPTVAAIMITTPRLPSSSRGVAAVNAQAIAGEQRQGLHTNATIQRIWDSGLRPDGDGLATWISWVDESTLLFVAKKRNPKPTTADGIPDIAWLYLWRLGERPQPHGDDPGEGLWFYRAARGIVCFQQKKIDPATGKASAVLKIGPPGAEREAPLWRPMGPKDGGPFNVRGSIEDSDCENFADPAMAGRIYETDYYRHYYLDRTAWPPGLPPAVGESPALVKSDGSNRRVLPIPPEEIGSVYLRSFDNAFWTLEDPLGSALRGGPMVDGFQKWRTTNCLAVWRIDPASGSTDRRCLPFGPWSGQVVDATHGTPAVLNLVPTAKGLFFTSTHYSGDAPDHVGSSGLYRLESGVVQRVLVGYIHHASPSPSGCRVALIYGPNWASRSYGTPGSWTIVAIDLCSSTEQSRAE
jgi:hypothetical protein